jgi:hypothetical protein
MSKYDGLGRFLRGQHTDMVPMTFREIERVTGSKLPASKRYPAWWSNNAGNSVMTKVWLAAGFKSEQVDVTRERLVFRRDAAVPNKLARTSRKAAEGTDIPHPVVGALKGTFTIEPGWDLTQPALDSLERQSFERSADKTGDLIDSGFSE